MKRGTNESTTGGLTDGRDIQETRRSQEHTDTNPLVRALVRNVFPENVAGRVQKSLLLCLMEVSLRVDRFQLSHTKGRYHSLEHDHLSTPTCLTSVVSDRSKMEGKCHVREQPASHRVLNQERTPSRWCHELCQVRQSGCPE
jgi:hypothetical protein